jgi:hypothetical protein
MKLVRILTLFFINICSFYIYADTEVDSLNIFNDKGVIERKKVYIGEGGMVFEQIYEYKDKNVNQLKGLIKNWGGQTFKSFVNVLVNETENQMVIRYNMGTSAYIKMIIDLKDNKLRLRLYDEDGRKMGYYFSEFYTRDVELCCVNGSGLVKNVQKRSIDNLSKEYYEITSISKELNKYIVESIDNKKESDW